MSAPARPADLLRLARLYGIQTAYYDIDHRRRPAAATALAQALRALGASLETPADATTACAARRAELLARRIEPVLVAWDGHLREIKVRTATTQSAISYALRFEDGSILAGDAPVRPTADAQQQTSATLELNAHLPLGYHVLALDLGGTEWETLIIAAPARANATGSREWGVFAPLYAYPRAGRAVGDFTGLERLCRWAGQHGASLVGTLPLLPVFLDRPFDPSPYAPVSRLFWNDLFVDPAAGPMQTPLSEAAGTRAATGTGAIIDYRAAAIRQRGALQPRAAAFFGGDGPDSADYRAFLQDHPDVLAYARFRAVGDRSGTRFRDWPSQHRNAPIADGFCSADVEYHLFAQYQAYAQMRRIRSAERDGAARLYLDLPLGVHPDGFDCWRWPQLFATGVTAGAPPDPLFRGGQDWGFLPTRPDALRKDRYRYVIACLRHHLRFARILRIDHVMSLQRLYWIPEGLPATEGVYVRYPREEMTAVLLLEAHRHDATIVGEDLGTVSSDVKAAMVRHRLHRMFVLPFEIRPRGSPLPTVPRRVVASLGTHDTPTFAAFWRGEDIALQSELGLLTPTQADGTRDARRATRARLGHALGFDGDRLDDEGTYAALVALLGFLSRSRARFLLVNLEDLWLETRPQNVPGTGAERPNWARRARLSFEQLVSHPEVARALESLRETRPATAGPRTAAQLNSPAVPSSLEVLR